jgi:large subunit ribosomal protein L7/L12
VKEEIKMAELEKIAEEISKLTLLEASALVKMLEEKLGVSAAAPVAVAMTPVAAAAAEPEEEQTEFNVILKEVGPKKIEVIKVVRQLTSLGLKEAKDLVDGAPSTVLEGVTKEAAADARAKLEEAGAVVEIK